MIISELTPHLTHDAARESCRCPIGAVTTGSSVTLAFTDGLAAVLEAELVLYGDGFESRCEMALEDGRWFVRVTMPEEAAALWYVFRLGLAGGEYWLCAGQGGRFGQLMSSRGEGFRLTVYERGFETPAWFRRSVMYQIFPDRFARDWSDTARDGIEKHREMGRQVKFHEDWGESVDWQPNSADGFYFPLDFYGGTLRLIRQAAKAEDPEAVVLGEVWEDAVIKSSYGCRRKYALGESLDSVMNYPFRSAVIDFLCFRTDARALASFLLGQRLNYPAPMYWSLMNLLSSHDVERVRTALATRLDARSLSREQQAGFIVGDAQDIRGASMQKLAAAIQFTLPGVPCVYYGDETGMGGMLDPFDRAPFTMGARPLMDWYASLGRIRNSHEALSTGSVAFSAPDPDVLCILRCVSGGRDVFGQSARDGAFLAVINRADWEKQLVADLWLDNAGLGSAELEGLKGLGITRARCLLTGRESAVTDGLMRLSLPPESALIFELA